MAIMEAVVSTASSLLDDEGAGVNGTEDTHTSLAVSDFALKVSYYCIGTLGFLGNLFVLYVIGRSPNMRNKITNMYILNQSTADLLCSIFIIFTTIFEEPEREMGGVQDEMLCMLWLSKWQLWAMILTSTYSLILITFERYLCVVHAIWHKTSFTPRKAIASIVVVWCFIVPYMGMYIIIPTGIVNGYCAVFGKFASFNAMRGTGFMNASMHYIIPLLLLTFFYARMALVLRKRIAPVKEVGVKAGAGGAAQSSQMSRAMNNVIKTLILVTLSFILCVSWNNIYFLMFMFGYPADFTAAFYHFTVIMTFCNCCINPIIYSCKYESFQRNARRLFPWLPRCSRRTKAEEGSVDGSVDTSQTAAG